MDRPKHMPASTPDFMAQAWIDCLRWAASSPEVLGDFEASTGIKVRPVLTPLDAMIEKATGYNRDCFEKFVAWFNEHIWGDVEALSPELDAEGWIALGDMDLMWLHEPSHRVIVLEEGQRHEGSQIPCWGPEPSDPKAEGYYVSCRVHDEQGNPDYGTSVWVPQYAVAVKLARKIRSDIMTETPAQARERKAEHVRRTGEAWREIFGGHR